VIFPKTLNNSSDVNKNKNKIKSLQKHIKKLSQNVSENYEDLRVLESEVAPQLEQFEQKFNKIENNYENIVNEIDEKDVETKKAFENMNGMEKLTEAVRTQGLLIDELRSKNNDETQNELELVKKDFILLKQDVFDLQENEKKLNGKSFMK
jgi:chromosome segregation ATPase